uniref:Uncharacterized protein n=1 Tax=Anguilla anguilla TaxID=7936 RepID=A0A0E9UMB5_ANGAN
MVKSIIEFWRQGMDLEILCWKK